jgi:hypothetical protein
VQRRGRAGRILLGAGLQIRPGGEQEGLAGGGLQGGQLLQHLPAIPPLLDHPLNPPGLPLDAPEAADEALFRIWREMDHWMLLRSSGATGPDHRIPQVTGPQAGPRRDSLPVPAVAKRERRFSASRRPQRGHSISSVGVFHRTSRSNSAPQARQRYS